MEVSDCKVYNNILKSILRDQYTLQGSHEFERFFPETSDSVKTNAYRSNLNVIFWFVEEFYIHLCSNLLL